LWRGRKKGELEAPFGIGGATVVFSRKTGRPQGQTKTKKFREKTPGPPKKKRSGEARTDRSVLKARRYAIHPRSGHKGGGAGVEGALRNRRKLWVIFPSWGQ